MKSAIERAIFFHTDFTLENECSRIQFLFDRKRGSLLDVIIVVNDTLSIKQYSYRQPQIDGNYLTIIGKSENLDIKIDLNHFKFSEGVE